MSTVLDLPRMASYRQRKEATFVLVLLLSAINSSSTILRRLTASNRICMAEMSTVLDLPRMASYRRRKLATLALVLLLLAINSSSTIRRLTASNRLCKEVMSTVLDLPRMASYRRRKLATLGLVLLLLAINSSSTIPSLDSLQSALQGGNVNSTRPPQDGVISSTKTIHSRPRAAVVGH